MRYVVEVGPRFVTTIVDTTAELAAGTVYNVVNVLALGWTCPSTLYVVGIIYAPIKRNTVGVESTDTDVVDAAVTCP